MRRLILLALLMSSLTPAYPQTEFPALDGYVTEVVSATNFAVDGSRVVCTPDTTFKDLSGMVSARLPWTSGPYLGEPLTIFGTLNHRKRTAIAKEIVLMSPEPSKVTGFGVIDRVISSRSGNQSSIMVRADGYPILVDSKTSTTFTAPLSSMTGVGTNVWISFAGMQGSDGVVVASKATFTANKINHGEGKLRGKAEYDPEKVTPSDRQGEASKLFLGVNPKKIPAYQDPAMQARIDRIGASLIPAYQRALPLSDPTKIHFRFQLIDDKKMHDALTMPSGVILVPRQVVERMQNDSQLAAVLADNMACALEKQTYRELPAEYKLTAAQAAETVGGVFVPGLGLAGVGANSAIRKRIQRHNEEQSGRVSLGLLMDANYDIYQAPLAWWLLAPKLPKNLSEIDTPDRARYLYWTLGTTWRSGNVTHR